MEKYLVLLQLSMPCGLLMTTENLPFVNRNGGVDLGVGNRGVGWWEKDWKERMERKLRPGCKINTLIN